MSNIIALANLEALLHNRILWALDCNDFLREDDRRVNDPYALNKLVLKELTELIQEFKINILMDNDNTLIYMHCNKHSSNFIFTISVKNFPEKFISFNIEFPYTSKVIVSGLELSEETNLLVLEKLSKLFFIPNKMNGDCIGCYP